MNVIKRRSHLGSSRHKIKQIIIKNVLIIIHKMFLSTLIIVKRIDKDECLQGMLELNNNNNNN